MLKSDFFSSQKSLSLKNHILIFLFFFFSASPCEPIRVEMCRGLSYNLTSFPNIWLTVSDQREAASILHKYRVRKHVLNESRELSWSTIHSTFLFGKFVLIFLQVLMELACFESFRRLVCGMFLPHCSPQSGVLQPCQSICSTAEQQCSHALNLINLNWPFNCHLLPDSQDPMECCLP